MKQRYCTLRVGIQKIESSHPIIGNERMSKFTQLITKIYLSGSLTK